MYHADISEKYIVLAGDAENHLHQVKIFNSMFLNVFFIFEVIV